MTLDILLGIYSEYGKKTFIEKIKSMFNIESKIDNNSDILFRDNSVLIKDKVNNLEYVITFSPENIEIIKIFSEYKITKKFNQNLDFYRQYISFPINNTYNFILDEMKDGNIDRRSFSINKNDDTFLTKGIYEYEIAKLPKKNIKSKYEYIKRDDNSINCTKIINMPSNTYFYSSDKNESTIYECTFSIIKPNERYLGRRREEKELIETLLITPFPCIIFYKKNSKTNELLYNVTITKKDKILTLHILYLDTNKNIELEIHGMKPNIINADEIELLLNILVNSSINYKEEIINYIDYLINIIKTKGNNIIKKFDIELQKEDNFNKLLFETYLNKDTMINEINKELKKTKKK